MTRVGNGRVVTTDVGGTVTTMVVGVLVMVGEGGRVPVAVAEGVLVVTGVVEAVAEGRGVLLGVGVQDVDGVTDTTAVGADGSSPVGGSSGVPVGVGGQAGLSAAGGVIVGTGCDGDDVWTMGRLAAGPEVGDDTGDAQAAEVLCTNGVGDGLLLDRLLRVEVGEAPATGTFSSGRATSWSAALWILSTAVLTCAARAWPSMASASNSS